MSPLSVPSVSVLTGGGVTITAKITPAAATLHVVLWLLLHLIF